MTQEKLNQLAEKVANILAINSQGVSEIPLVEEMNGINSLPCLRKTDDVEEVVEVPIPILATPSLEAAKLATDAAKDAESKAQAANAATADVRQLEATIKGNEEVRETAESQRISAEQGRHATEAERITSSQTAVSNANKATARLNSLSNHRDEIRDGYWWHWNEGTEEYENTGELAKGNTLFASFDIDPMTGELSCTTDEEYTGPSFNLENGDLVITI